MMEEHYHEQRAAQATADDIDRAMSALRSVFRAARLNTREIELQIGMGLAQLFVLQSLSERPAGSLSELAARAGTHQSSLSVVVRRLVDKGYVERTTSSLDRRRLEIRVTPSGAAILADAPVTIQSRLIASLRSMAPSERHALAGLLHKWAAGAGIEMSGATMFGDDAPIADVSD